MILTLNAKCNHNNIFITDNIFFTDNENFCHLCEALSSKFMNFSVTQKSATLPESLATNITLIGFLSSVSSHLSG
ncbi:hypothetical protein EB796_010037 [Bugula neritina]|uniref:Uncharacterized protein n=1 Tax=Bugula neritina TaxID=10212 RepID=A0A7J7K123_BUGNE|nr:hypothetical protein EB796_010037 [Bugula neritina]